MKNEKYENKYREENEMNEFLIHLKQREIYSESSNRTMKGKTKRTNERKNTTHDR